MLWRFLAKNKKALVAGSAIVAALALFTTGWRGGQKPGTLDRGVMFLASPILKSAASFSHLGEWTYDFLFGWRGLREENMRLREEIYHLRRQAEERREQDVSYRRLASILDFRKQKGYRMTVASVIGHDSTNLFQTILLNKGAREEIRKDMAVVTPEGVVGKVIKVFASSSRVLLLTDRSSGIDALVQRTRDQGVVQGLGTPVCEMKYLSRQSTVDVGDTIITSGMGGTYPKGMRVGQVTDVRKGGYLLQNVEIRPAVALDKIEEVIVLLGSGEREGG